MGSKDGFIADAVIPSWDFPINLSVINCQRLFTMLIFSSPKLLGQFHPDLTQKISALKKGFQVFTNESHAFLKEEIIAK